MKLLKTSRKFHKWLMLFLGIQFLIWSISGAYMVIFDIDYIHGDSLVVNHQTWWVQPLIYWKPKTSMQVILHLTNLHN